MPRLSAAPSLALVLTLGCVPESVDTSGDQYLTLRPGPDALIDGDGNYNGGWYDSFDGVINPEDSTGAGGAFKGWLHFSLLDDDYAVAVNLADLNTAGNAAISVVDVTTGENWTESTREAFGDNNMVISDDFSEIVNDNDGSYMRVVDDGATMEFDVQAHGMNIAGTLISTGADPFIQVTRYHDGYGILQWYEQVEVEQATVTLADGTQIELPAGMRGTSDRMAGHRRTHQQWNWVATSAVATTNDGEEIDLALTMTHDQAGARPQVPSKKYGLWVDGVLHKVPSLSFDYTVLDDETRTTTSWTIASDDADVDDRVDLTFSPVAHRHDETGYLWFYYTNYNLYVGRLSGSVTVEGKVYYLDDVTAVAEDATLTL